MVKSLKLSAMKPLATETMGDKFKKTKKNK